VGFKAKRKSKSYRELIKMIAQTSGYHQYEVEDVLNHFVGNVQVLLAADMPVKISGLGTIKVKKMHVSRMFSTEGEKVCYDAYRLSVVSDNGLQLHLKENYEQSAERNTSSYVALPNDQQ
jgi:nucleoid DNA-binding protein